MGLSISENGDVRYGGRRADPLDESDRQVRLVLPYWLWRRIYDQAEVERVDGGRDEMGGSVVGVIRRILHERIRENE